MYYFTVNYYLLYLLFYHDPSRLHLGNRPAPVHPGFYYFTISVLYSCTMYYFPVNYSTICYSTTTPAVCISETDLRRFTQHFTILLPRPQPFSYFTILLYHDPSRLHLANPPLQVVP